MKKKFLICTLCLTIVFSSLNYKKSYADGGILSLPMLSVVSALAVGTGIAINNNDDLYDIGRLFYDYVSHQSNLTWEAVNLAFASVSALPNKYVSVNSDFLDIVKGFFDSKFSNSKQDISLPYVGNGVPGNFYSPCVGGKLVLSSNAYMFITSSKIDIYLNDVVIHSYTIPSTFKFVSFKEIKQGYVYYDCIYNGKLTTMSYKPTGFNFSNSSVGSLPYNGSYTWDNLESKREEDKSIALPVPGDLGQLVGQGVTDFWDNTDNLVGSGDISVPDVENPSISLDNTTSFPNTNVDTSNPSIPDVDAPTVDGILPAFPSFGDSLDFSPMYLTNVTEKFPFSLPWDIGRLIQKFDVEPVAPIFEVPIVSETITLDLTEFSELASIVRFFVLIGFILALVFISTKLMA